MYHINRISGHLRWGKPITEGQLNALAELAPGSVFVTANWADFARTAPTEKAGVFEALRALAGLVKNTEGHVEFLYSGLEFEFFTITDHLIYRWDGVIDWEAKQLIVQPVRPHQDRNTYDYTGMLKLTPLSDDRLARLKTIIERHGTPYYEAETNRLTFHHSTDDFNRWYVAMMAEIAAAVTEARGEVVCRVCPPQDAEEPEHYERYEMREGRLLVQRGELTRSAPVPIPT